MDLPPIAWSPCKAAFGTSAKPTCDRRDPSPGQFSWRGSAGQGKRRRAFCSFNLARFCGRLPRFRTEPIQVTSSEPVSITLALQGGGSLGAFTWGVLDRLLERPELRIEAVSGASAGAMNAAMLVQGLATGGPAEAKRLLEDFWCRVAITPGCPDPATDLLLPVTEMIAPVVDALRQTTSGWSRNQLNPLGLNPLRGVLDALLDPSAFAKRGAPMLVVSATRVRTGEARLFHGAAVSAQVLLASACLPQLFPAVEVEGEPYWDGGYASNPPLRALIVAGAPADILVVRTMPVERLDVPTNAAALVDRTNELASERRSAMSWSRSRSQSAC